MKPLTLVLGASPDASRYSYRAVRSLVQHGYPVRAIGKRSGTIDTIPIETNQPYVENVDTITVYLSALHQESIKDYVIQINPRRVIFNPGAENPSWQADLTQRGIQCLEACTLVMLSTGQYE